MRTGDVLHERFEIERLAEKGGMGAVFRAKDLSTGQPVALKVLHAFAMGEASRMEREAHALMKVRHPGIVRYVAHGLLDDERPFLAMEWLDGEDLRQRTKRQELRLSDAVALGYRVAEALAAAHAAGVVHRDVKPSNIFLSAARRRRSSSSTSASRASPSPRATRRRTALCSGRSLTWRRSRRAARAR